jgi:hypothetical protein
MSNEDLERVRRIERHIESILEQQAKFDSDIARISEALDKNREAVTGLLQVSRTLINSQIGAEGRMAKIEERMAELAAAEKRTDERLDSFINFFERYMSRGGANPESH